MTKKILTTLLVAAFSFTSFAQTVEEQNVEIKKEKVNAFVATYSNIKEDVVNGAFEQYFDKNIGGSSSKSSGFRLYKGATWKEISPDKADVYYKVDGGKKETKVYVLYSKGYNNFVSTNSDGNTAQNVKTFLKNFGEQIIKFQKEKDIAAQQKVIDGVNSDLKKYKDEETDIKKKQENLAKDLNNVQSKISKEQDRLNAETKKLSEISAH